MTSSLMSEEIPVSEWKRYYARMIALHVSFASMPQSIETLEGPVQCVTGDAIVTGVKGERWPIPRARFDDIYSPVPPTRPGQSGHYCKKQRTVSAGRLTADYAVVLSDDRGVLHGQPGDMLVKYAEGDCSVVAADIFEQTYQSVDD